MDKVIEALKDLKGELDNNPLIQEFLSLKEALKNNQELKSMREDIARLTSEGKIEERDNLIKLYNSHPLVNNYNATREEVIALLNEIKDVLSD